jgi:hypothetical protein
MVINPDLLGEGVKIVRGYVILNQIFNLLAQYLRKVHSGEFIRKCLCYAPWRSYLDIIGPNDIVYNVSIIKNSKDMCIVFLIKNSKDMWDQDIRMQELGTQAICSQDKKLQPLFTSGSGKKRTQGKNL